MTTSASENPGNVIIDRYILTDVCFLHSPALFHIGELYLCLRCCGFVLCILHTARWLHRTQSLHQPQPHLLYHCVCGGHPSKSAGHSHTHLICAHLFSCFSLCLYHSYTECQDYALNVKAVLLWGVLGFVGVCRIKMWTFALYMCYRNLSRVLVCSSRLSSLSTPCISHGLLWATTPVSLATRSHVHTNINLFNAVSLLSVLIYVTNVVPTVCWPFSLKESFRKTLSGVYMYTKKLINEEFDIKVICIKKVKSE